MCFKIKFIYKINKDLIFDYMNKNNLDITEFCDICKITIKEFSNLMKNNPYIDTLIFAKIVKKLKINFDSLFVQ